MTLNQEVHIHPLRRTALIASLATAVAVSVPCSPAAAQRSEHHSDAAMAVRVGTTGYAVDLSKLVNPHIAVRAEGALYSFSGSHTQSDIMYDIDLKLHSVSLLLDLYPGARGHFHLTGGVTTKPAEVTATGQPTGATFSINGITYTGAQVGVLTGTAKYPSAAPYFGLGFGTPARGGRFMFVFDLGAIIAKPTIALTATGAAGNPALAADLQTQVQTTQDDVNKYAKVYPVISLGVGYRF